MDKRLIDFLNGCPIEPFAIDRLLVSAFIYSNDVPNVLNAILRSYIINENDTDYILLLELRSLHGVLSFEDLIELFEFVVSPSDKIVTGAIYTPNYIREYIVKNVLSAFVDLDTLLIADIACGCGSFLLTLSRHIKQITGKAYSDIFANHIYGNDIAPYSIERTKLLLSLFAVLEGEDQEIFDFKLFVGNSLSFNWRESCPEINRNGGFDAIVGNPPYVCSRNMDSQTLKLIKNWQVARTGHPDLYIPFFEIALEHLNANGLLGYITVNTFIKSINGRALRQYFDDIAADLTIISFGGEQVFQNRNTYTCICLVRKNNPQIKYLRTLSTCLENLDPEMLNRFDYQELNHHDGWNLVNDVALTDFIDAVEHIGIPFKNLYNTKNGIATLKNDVFKFIPVSEDENFFYLKNERGIFPIEKDICRDIVNANKLKGDGDLQRLKEQIIFPYDKKIKIYSPAVMRAKFSRAFSYLQENKDLLARRDKGNREYEQWYAYGRRQSMDINAFKLFFPHICERPRFILSQDKDLLFYNGMAIVSDNLQELELIKRILESEVFYKYIRNTTKDYSSGYISMSRNYLKNFGVVQLNEDQKHELIFSDDPEPLIHLLYGVEL